MSVQEGMDVERVRQIAGDLQRNGEALTNIGAQGRGQLSVLSRAWEGPDIEKFSGSWGAAEKSLAAASQTIQAMGKGLQQQATDQHQSSQASGSILGGGRAGLGGSGAPTLSGTSTTSPNIIDHLSTVVGRLGALGGVNDIVKALNGGRGLGALLSQVPALTKPLLSPGARLGLFMQAQLTHPLFGKGAAALFGSSRLAPLFNGSVLQGLKGFGKLLGPLGAFVGGYDLAAGIMKGDWSQAISGGLGIASVAAPLLIASGPAGWAVGGALAIGSFVAAQWGDEIADGAKAAWNWTGDRLADAGGAVTDFAEDAGSVLSSGAKKLGGLFS